MSLDNMSQLGGTRLDELVPYRYALQVGEIDVLVISDGVLPIPATTMAYNTDSSGLAVWLDGMFLPPDVLEALRFQDRSWGRWWTRRTKEGPPPWRWPLFRENCSAALVHAGIHLGSGRALADLVDPVVVAQVRLGGRGQTQDSCDEPAGDDAGKSELLHCGAFFFADVRAVARMSRFGRYGGR